MHDAKHQRSVSGDTEKGLAALHSGHPRKVCLVIQAGGTDVGE
jgi:hypothetical protein